MIPPLEKLRRCELGCFGFGQCKANMHGVPSRCPAASARPLPPSMTQETLIRIEVALEAAVLWSAGSEAKSRIESVLAEVRALRAASAPQAVHALTEEETRAVHELVAGAAFVCAITDTAQLVDCTLTAIQSVIARRSGIVPLAPQDTGEA